MSFQGTAVNDERDERPQDYARKDEEEAEEDYDAPSRWWLITTLLPLVAATFGPIASMFHICSFIDSFAVVVDLSSTEGVMETEGAYVQNLGWIWALLSVSLVFGIVANLTTLLHNLGRIPFAIAQPIAIVGWYVASFLLIAVVAAAASYQKLPGGVHRTFSQSYYYACFASGLYLLLAILMSLVAWSIHVRKVSHEYKLTMAQRTLMLQVILFLGYVLCAAAVYMRVEYWDYLDALYWMIVTVFTIGFGDFHPNTHLGRSLFFPAAVGGILFVGLIVASISTVVLEAGSHKISRRNIEKARKKMIATMDTKHGFVRVPPFYQKMPIGKSAKSELDRREMEFNLMRQVQQNALWTNSVIAISISAGSFVFLWVVGAIVFWRAEQSTQEWSYFEALYFTFVSFTTIGYGDFYPQDNSAKPAFVFWALLALPTLTILIGAIGSTISEGVNAATLWMGEKLPADTPGLGDLKEASNKKKKGEGGEFSSAKPKGFMEKNPESNEELGDDAEGQAVQGLSGDLHASGDSNKADQAEDYRAYLLMTTIKNVVNHLDATPPRKYEFAEWVYFLKLLGEDEEKGAEHRDPSSVQDDQTTGTKEAGLEDGQKGHSQNSSWSWLAKKNPLMSADSEPKYVLGRLMDELEKELKQLGNKRSGRATDA